MSYRLGSFLLQNKSRLCRFLFCKSSLVFENPPARRALGEESSASELRLKRFCDCVENTLAKRKMPLNANE